jgi:hypothetical protein
MRCRHAFAQQIAGAADFAEQQLRQLIGQYTVDFLRHRAVVTA